MSGYLLLLLVSVLTCAGQLCQKQAAVSWQSLPLAGRWRVTLRWLILACLAMGGGMLFWLVVLQRLPLSVAYPMLSLNFIFITLCARFFFAEPTSSRHWAGVASIMLGILLMAINP